MFNPLERRVVITGIGAVTPNGNNVTEYWNALAEGRSGIRTIRNIDIDASPIKIAGEIDITDDFKEHFVTKKLFKRLDRNIVIGYVAAAMAFKDSGIDVSENPERYGAIIGSGEGGLTTQWDQLLKLQTRGYEGMSPYYIPNVIPNTATALFCQEMGIRGLSFSVSTACATANHAMGIAATHIRMGLADAVFAGGTEAVAVIPGLAAFNAIGALSKSTGDPTKASRPFDRDRNGFVMGEGAGVLCLEELDHARKRGARIYGELTGFGFTSDAYDLVAPHPDGEGAASAISHALAMAGLDPKDIDLVNCHGTSTPLGDKAESNAILRALGQEVGKKVPVHSTKSMIGHLIGAAGAVEAIAVLLAINKGIIHPSINVENQDPDIPLNVVKQTVEGAKVRHALSNTFGFGGHNAAVVLSKFE